MQKFLKIVSSALLLFNGIGAIYGGLNLMIHPDGSSIQLSPEWLEYTPFHDYFIPGVILFICNGFFSIFVFTSILLNAGKQTLLIMTQGFILSGWILIQILMIRTIYFLHVILGAVGLALIVLGWMLRKYRPNKP